MVSVLAFISGVIRGGSSLTGPTESWAATKTGNTNGIAASNRFMGYSVFGSCSTVWDRRRERLDVLCGPPERGCTTWFAATSNSLFRGRPDLIEHIPSLPPPLAGGTGGSGRFELLRRHTEKGKFSH